MKLSEKIQEALREQQEINLSDPAVQKRLAAQWGYVSAEAQPAPTIVNGMITPARIAQAIADGTITQAYIMQPAPSVPEVTDAMAIAFHAALTDGGIGLQEVEEIKTGLRAALAAAPEAKS